MWPFRSGNDALDIEKRQIEPRRTAILVAARDDIRTLKSTLQSARKKGALNTAVTSMIAKLQEINEHSLLNGIPEPVLSAFDNRAILDQERVFPKDLVRNYRQILIAIAQYLRQAVVEDSRGATLAELQDYLEHAASYVEQLLRIEAGISKYEQQLAGEQQRRAA